MGKRVLALFLALTMCLALLPAAALAAGSGFTIENGVLTKYTGPGGAVTIPDGVINIGQFAFAGCNTLTSVTIPNGVTFISMGAFQACSSLTSVTIPDTVTFIDGYVFEGCTALTEVDIPDSVAEIGKNAFNGCRSLTSVVIPNGIWGIYENTFHECESLASVTIPDSVTYIGWMAFANCHALANLNVPDSVRDIDRDAFAYSNVTLSGKAGSRVESYAKENNIPFTAVAVEQPAAPTSGTCGEGVAWHFDEAANVLTISGTGAIDGYEFPDYPPWVGYQYRMTEVHIEPGVTSIGSHTFRNAKNLVHVTIPDSVKSIGICAFCDCTALPAIAIPASVEYIGLSAFSGCTSLASVTISNSDADIESAFYNTPWLKNQGNFVVLGSTLLAYQGTDSKAVVPDGITKIGSGAFADCPALTEITIPSGVVSIGDQAFSSCSGLTSVVIPDGVTVIGDNAFYNCTSLTSVTLPDSVTEIKDGAFILCKKLNSLDIPGSVTAMGDAVFQYCASLTSVVIPDGVPAIGDGVFYNCSALTSVAIPDSVTSIGANAFIFTDLKNIYYGGSEAQWQEIKISSNDNDDLRGAAIHYNSTGSETPASLPTVEPIPATGTVYARTQTVKLDGKDVAFQCYAVKNAEGNENNYVKVRDLAQALNGTKAQFNVGWDGKISMIPNTAYVAVGGEGTTPYTGDQPYSSVSDIPVRFNGSDVNLTSFSITYQGGGYTYYKLRDLGQLLNFNVTWDNGVIVETDKPYAG